MKTINKIFIDLDGTLLDGTKRQYYCYCKVISKYGGTPISYSDYTSMKRKRCSNENILENSLFKGTKTQYICAWKELIESPQMLKYDEIKSGSIELLNFLDRNNYYAVLITKRKSREHLLEELRNLNIEKYFKEIIVVEQQQSKFSKVMGMNTRNSIVIGDTEDDEMLADKINAPFIAVTTGMREKELLSADYYVDNIDEIIQIIGGKSNNESAICFI